MEKVLRERLPGGKFDNVPVAQSRRMRAIRSNDNRSTERRFKLALVRARIRGWKLRPGGIIGKPDFLFPAARVVVFLDGCFWHGCPDCQHDLWVNKPYWTLKIQRNQERDAARITQLEAAGFRVLRFWEHQLLREIDACIDSIRTMVSSERGGLSYDEERGHVTSRRRVAEELAPAEHYLAQGDPET